MCGFIVSAISNDYSQEVFNRALENLNHRGPDQTKTHKFQNIIFGFKRLSIQDLSNLGSQPMIDDLGNILCFNGEIYNFKYLKEKLIQENIAFKSNSDTEVLLQTIYYYGIEKSLELIDGMFSFIYFNRKLNKIYACTDHFGMKPLYYFISGKNFIFSSEIKGILPLLNQYEVNIKNSLNPIFFTNFSPGEKTIFNNIFSLGPGRIITFSVDSSELTNEKYFDLSSLINENEYLLNSKLSNNDIALKVSDTLDLSIKTHLVSDANAGILFSAGIDSSIIAKKAHDLNKKSVNLFKYQSSDMDDSKLAEVFSNNINAKTYITKNIDSTLIYKLPHLIYAYETLNKADGAPLSVVCENANNLNYKVLLTGDCADELFGGYGSFDTYRLNQLIKNFLHMKNLNNLTNKIFPGLRSLFIESMHHMISPFDDRFINPYLDFSLFDGERNQEWQKCRESYSFLKNNYQINCNAFLLDEIKNRMRRFLLRSDRVGMMHSVELRMPYLTKSMAKLSLNIPFNKKSAFMPSYIRKRMFIDKIPLRKIARDLSINKGIINRPKVGTPTGKIDDNNLFYLVSIFSLKNVSTVFGIKETIIKQFLVDIEFYPIKIRLYWTFLSFELILRMFFMNISPNEIEVEIKEIITNK